MTDYVASTGERYRVIDELGVGGFASTVRVEDAAGDRYALKRERFRGFGRDRLVKEAESLQQIEHPNVIAYRARGSEPDIFVVVELAADGSLQDRVDEARRRQQDIPLRTIVAWGLQLLDGLAAIHVRMLHCDVKASNILLRGPVPKISDFGSARPLGRTHPIGPLDTAAVSTPSEGWLGAKSPPPGPAYDLYGVGVILFHLATLRPPFLGSREEVRLQHLLRRPPRPATLRPDLPDPLERLILQLLEKDPDRRGTSAICCRRQLVALAEMGHLSPDEP